jgi:acyl-CoA synthetase (AMP-forming)/AMP-acid ligase II
MFVMYGQTEATARISYVPAERLGDKIGSIGLAIPGGELSLSHIDGSDMDELIYRGANVMMGYADSADSLANGDKLGGVLRTGDLARVDADGFYSIVGRLKRIGKLFGKRFNLEDVESGLEAHYAARAAAIDTGSDQLRVWVAPLNTESAIQQSELHKHIYTRLGVTPSAVIVQMIDALPMTSNGKKDYAALGK